MRRRLDGRLFVAHNARFDYGFLRAEFRRLGQRYTAPVLCTVRLSRLLSPEESRHNLDALIDRHRLTCNARHRALGDAEVLPPLLACLARATSADIFAETCARVLHEPRLPAQLPPELADDLPDAPGVYVFRDEHSVPLYVGKGNNIRSRVLAHFAAARHPASPDAAGTAQGAATTRTHVWPGRSAKSSGSKRAASSAPCCSSRACCGNGCRSRIAVPAVCRTLLSSRCKTVRAAWLWRSSR